MTRYQRVSSVAAVLGTLALAGTAEAALLRVPRQYATIQEAVTAARPGDAIAVSRGRYCGATIDKPVHLFAHGRVTIEGCEEGPALPNGARIGFFLPGSVGESPASGTSIHGFTFEGRGVSNENLEPIAFGIFGRFVDGARVSGNRFRGTVQAITNTAGDGWLITHNQIEGLTLFDCTRLCTGGDGIVLQPARGSLAVLGGPAEPANRAENNWIGFNRISGAVPDGFDVFAMAGILVFASDRTTITNNWIALPDNPLAPALGQGVVVTNVCCGEAPLEPGSRRTFIGFNFLAYSERGVVVEGERGANTLGLTLRRNRGSVHVEEPAVAALALRVAEPSAAPPAKELFY